MMQAALIATLLLASPAQDDAFCDALKQVVASAPDQFRGVRGALVERTDDSWHASIFPLLDAPRGAECRISSDDWRNGRSVNWQYWCFTSYATDAEAPDDAKVAAVADRAARCVGGEVRVIRDPVRDKLGYPAERRIAVGPFEIEVRSTRMEFLVVMDGPYRPPEPYLGDSTGHDFWLTLTVRRQPSGS